MALNGIAANMLFEGRGSRTGSAMAPLDRALLSSYRMLIVTVPPICNGLAAICNANFDWGVPTPNVPFLWRTGPLSNSVTVLGTTRVSLPNGISFRPTALAGYRSAVAVLRWGQGAQALPNLAQAPQIFGHSNSATG